jgi:putative sporulation protein YtxC
MQFLCIGVDESADYILQQITDEFKAIDSNKLGLNIDKVDSGDSASIICSIKDKNTAEIDPKDLEMTRIHISNALADYIIQEYEEKLISRIINTNYCYFNLDEKKDIFELSLKIVQNNDKNLVNSLFQVHRRNVIIRRLIEYLENSDSIILEGFVNFRLKDYIKDLEEVVEKAVDDFLMEREYNEFIRLLKYFVEIQEPKFEVIHVLVGYDSKYVLLDEKHREITNECIQEFVNDITMGDINYDDLLVGSLITMAPKKVVIHSNGQFKNRELLETIKNVFNGKVVLCSQCELCSHVLSKTRSNE